MPIGTLANTPVGSPPLTSFSYPPAAHLQSP